MSTKNLLTHHEWLKRHTTGKKMSDEIPGDDMHTIHETVGGYLIKDAKRHPVCVVTQNDNFRTWDEAKALAVVMANALEENYMNSHQSLKRGVWCRTCGRSQRVDSSDVVQNGWPKCCGCTMTIDSPEEQKRLADKAS